MTLSLYLLRRTPIAGEYFIAKLDRDYNPEGIYTLSARECSCPRSHKHTCRHREMLPVFLKAGHVDDGWFLEWETRQWRRPLASEASLQGEDQDQDSLSAPVPHQPAVEHPAGKAGESSLEAPTSEVEPPQAPSPAAVGVGASPTRMIRRRV